MPTYTLQQFASVTLGVSGAGSAFLQPNAGERWHISRVAVKTNQASTVTTIPTAFVYLGDATDGNFFDGTYTGSQDASDCDLTIEQGARLTCVWAGGVAGSVATLTAWGTRETY